MKTDMVTSSKLLMNAKIQPPAMPGNMSGKVMRLKTTQGFAPKEAAACSTFCSAPTSAVIALLGLSGWVKRVMSVLPMPIVMGMVAGVFLRFGLDLVRAFAQDAPPAKLAFYSPPAAVVAPARSAGGRTAMNTTEPVYTSDWASSRDYWPDLFAEHDLVGTADLRFLEIGCFEALMASRQVRRPEWLRSTITRLAFSRSTTCFTSCERARGMARTASSVTTSTSSER